ncbi:MAG TPA: glutamine-hydrolyzing carbamoyl-phosphate synthase small subunit [Polyangiales bacterium]|nr:glutamine-hydrolyzing carbamoyl-phosphate synthase small subunit [Polyangiales bacterium]
MTQQAQPGRKAHIVLADGTAFPGVAIGATGHTVGEAVFTTGMTGYQEVLTDPSYAGQIVTMTATQMGNTGVNTEDTEATRPHVAGFVVHELARLHSNWRAQLSLDDYLKQNGIVAIAGVDTRALTRHLRDHGAQAAAIGCEDVATLHDRAKAAPSMIGRDLTAEVTTERSYEWSTSTGEWALSGPRDAKLHVVAIDYGVKQNILRCLVESGCRVTVVPAKSSAADVLSHQPDGVFLSNGPGDPAAVEHGIRTVRDLLGKRPMFGICLGHQLLSLALGGKTYKLKFGHRGLNQPVKDLATGRIEVTTQNHGFCVDLSSLENKCELTHLHLNDGTCEGIRHKETGAFSVQYHPEASAGPHDARYLFRRFIDQMEARR